MRRRSKSWLWVLLLGLTPQLGCVTLKDSTLAGPYGPEAAKANTILPDPEAAKLCLAAAAKFEETGHYAEAAAQLEKARSHDPKLEVTHRLALVYEESEDYARALVEYNKELTAKPREANLWNDVGVCFYKKRDWAESEKCLRKALELNPQHLYAWGNLGEALAAQGRLDESLQAFQHTVPLPAAFCNVAFVQASLGKLTEARATYHKALELEPQNRVALSALAELDKMEEKAIAKPAQGS
jgi:Tfp pilus assembly protein PilF